jgi:hypothetical protein
MVTGGILPRHSAGTITTVFKIQTAPAVATDGTMITQNVTYPLLLLERECVIVS